MASVKPGESEACLVVGDPQVESAGQAGSLGSIFRDKSYRVSSSMIKALSNRYCVTWQEEELEINLNNPDHQIYNTLYIKSVWVHSMVQDGNFN